MKTVTIYTDGACSGNPGPGGWGAILEYRGREKELSGAEALTTNNRMELTAVIRALEQLKEPCRVELWSDSKYVTDALSLGWARSWQARGWKKPDKKPALNPDLWARLLELCEQHTVHCHWVKGHADNPKNNRCDQLAVAAREAIAAEESNGRQDAVPAEKEANAMKKSQVFFTRELSPEGLKRLFARISAPLTGKVAVKLHTGEKNGPNIIPSAWVKDFLAACLPDAVIVETNTFYAGDRDSTEKHRETLKVNGWDFCPVDIMDEEGTTMLPVAGGKWFTEMSMGSHVTRYDSLLALTHFKGHVMGGFGGSNKNLGIGMADGRLGKKMIHQREGSDNMWSIAMDELMERIAESTKATVDHFAGHIAYLNVLRNMSVSCDCEGLGAQPVVTPNIGMVASLDILAVDQASVDLVYALNPADNKALTERIETRHGLRQLSYMKELGMGSGEYALIDIDNNDAIITPTEAVKDVVPFSPFML